MDGPLIILATALAAALAVWVLWTKIFTGKKVESSPAPAAAALPPIAILYATEHGTSRQVAEKVRSHFGHGTTVHNAATFDVETIASLPVVVFVVSTYQDGTPPPAAQGFASPSSIRALIDLSHDFRFSADTWSKTKFAVFGCGSLNYTKNYNAFGKEVHESMLRKSGVALMPLTLSDEATTMTDVCTFVRSLRKALTGEVVATKEEKKALKAAADTETEEEIATGEDERVLSHSVALATTRDAIVAFGEGYGRLLVPVERRIAQYLRQERLFAVGGDVQGRATRSCWSDRIPTRSCYSLDVCGSRRPQ